MKYLFFAMGNQSEIQPLPNTKRKLGSRRIKTGALLLLLLSPFASEAMDNVRLQLKWNHQFQFAGYYAAQAQGYYEAAGLDVEILSSQPGENAVQQVLQGKAEFGVGSTDLLLLREQGQPVVALAVIFQHSPLALMTLKQDGIQSIHDLAGRKVMMEPEAAELYAYLEKEGVSTEKFTLLPHSLHTKDLLSGKVDAMSIYVTDEPFELRTDGLDYLLYSPRSVGIDFYGDNLFTTEQQLEQNPERVKAFREASLKGWVYAMANPEEMVQLIHSRYSQRHTLEHLQFEADQMAALLQASLIEIGHMNPGRWRHIAETYATLGLMKPDVDLKGFLYDPNPPPPDLFWSRVFVSLAIVVIICILAVALFIYRANVRLHREGKERQRAEKQVAALLEESNQSRNALLGIIEDEERGRAALSESEERYRTLFDRAQDGILILSFEGKVLSVNDSFARMHGYDPEEMQDFSLKDINAPASAEGISERMADLRAGRSLTFEVEHLHKEGYLFPLEGSASPISIDGETIVQTFYRDITERKKTEAALIRKDREISKLKDFSIGLSTMASEENLEQYIAKKLKEICGATGVIFNEYDAVRKVNILRHLEVESKLFDVVQTQLKFLSKDKSAPVSDEMFKAITTQVIGVKKTLHEITYGAIPKPIGAAIQKLLKVDRFIGIPYFIEGKLYGTSVIAMGKDMPDPSRELLESLALLSAVTLRRKQAEKALSESEIRFKALHNATFGGIAIHDQGIILECNLGLSELTGYSTEELIGMDGALLIAEQSREMVQEHIRSGYESPYEAVGLRKNGTEYSLRLAARNIPYKGTNSRAVEFRDITERKQAEITLRDRNNELERFNKASVGRELRMIELKKEVNALCRQLEMEQAYPLHSNPEE